MINNICIGGKTSISLFGGDDAQPDTYQKSSQAYAPPTQSYPPQEPSYSSYSAQPSAPAYEPSYQPPSNENQNPYTTSSSATYAPYVASSYQNYQASHSDVTAFGAAKNMRSEHNLGADGEERTSVKVHNPPGGGSSLNLFGGPSEPAYKDPPYKAPAYEPAQYQAPSYGASAGYQGVAAGMSSSSQAKPMFGEGPQPAQHSYTYEEQKYQAPEPDYNAPPPGYTSSASYGQPQPIEPASLNVASTQMFGQRVESGSNSGPHTDKSSIRVHAPPGGKSSIFF